MDAGERDLKGSAFSVSLLVFLFVCLVVVFFSPSF